MLQVKHNMKWKDLKKTSDGYSFNFTPAKQRGAVREGAFVVPKKPEDVDGVDYVAILDVYVETVNKQISPAPEDQIFWTGRLKSDGSSKFTKQHLGISEIRAVPKFIASWLKKDNPEKYTGTFFQFSNS